MKKARNYFEINSINEYIDCVTKNNLGNCISRGENSRFDHITASAFRFIDIPAPHFLLKVFHALLQAAVRV